MPGVRVIAASTLTAVARLAAGHAGFARRAARRHRVRPRPGTARFRVRFLAGADLAEMLGQSMARRAAEVCAACGHHLSLLGPPGGGQDHAGLNGFPPFSRRLDRQAALEATAIHSVAGTLPTEVPLLCDPPFLRAPSHRDQGRDRGRRQRRHPSRLGVAGAPRGACSSMRRPSSPGTCWTRCASRCRWRGRGGPVGGHGQVPGQVHPGHGLEPVPVCPRGAGSAGAAAPPPPPPVPGPDLRPPARPGGREDRARAGQPPGTAQRPGLRRVQPDRGAARGRGQAAVGAPAARHPDGG